MLLTLPRRNAVASQGTAITVAGGGTAITVAGWGTAITVAGGCAAITVAGGRRWGTAITVAGGRRSRGEQPSAWDSFGSWATPSDSAVQGCAPSASRGHLHGGWPQGEGPVRYHRVRHGHGVYARLVLQGQRIQALRRGRSRLQKRRPVALAGPRRAADGLFERCRLARVGRRSRKHLQRHQPLER